MPDRSVDVLLIGGGVACAAAAKALRDDGFGGSILLAGRELDPPYDRPVLTKEYLRGESGKEDAAANEPGWYAQAGVELLTRTSVTKLDTEAHQATLSTKETVGYGQALIATGAMVRRLQVDGTELDGLHYIRAFGNADAIRRELDEADEIVCVGGSYIGCEVAASLTQLGKRVSIVMQEREPMERGFGADVGAWFRDVLEARGVTILGEDEIERFAGAERVERVVTKGGREHRGAARRLRRRRHGRRDARPRRRAGAGGERRHRVRRPAADLGARTSGRPATSASTTAWSTAGGSASSTPSTRRPRAATSRARCWVRREPYDVIPYFYSDLADWASLEYVGPAAAWDEEVVRGSLVDGSFGVWYLQDGRVAGALSVGGGLDLDAAQELIRSGEPLPR